MDDMRDPEEELEGEEAAIPLDLGDEDEDPLLAEDEDEDTLLNDFGLHVEEEEEGF